MEVSNIINIIHIRLIKQKYRDTGSNLKLILYTDYSDIDRLDFTHCKHSYGFQTICLCRNSLVRTLL